jgi:membrane protease YdiL (CAAX protease family)
MIDSATAATALAIVLVVLPMLAGPFERRFLHSNPSTAGKLAYYGMTMVALWTLTAAADWIFGVERLGHLQSPWRSWLPWASIAGPVICVLLAGFFLMSLMPLVQSLRGPRWRRAYAQAYRRHAEGFPGLLPDTAVERFGFVLLSLTAGVCEEALYRGFLIRYLHDGVPGLPLLLALAAASLAFGLAHLYQGGPGVIRTGLAGLAFGLLFLLSGSLIPGIVLHALVDLQGAYVLRPLPDPPSPA